MSHALAFEAQHYFVCMTFVLFCLQIIIFMATRPVQVGVIWQLPSKLPVFQNHDALCCWESRQFPDVVVNVNQLLK